MEWCARDMYDQITRCKVLVHYSHFEASVCKVGAAKRCILYFGRDHVVATDEHRTSAISFDSQSPLSKVYEEKVGKDGKSRGLLVRGLRLCRSTAPGLSHGRSRLVDRDINAALNIRLVAMSAVLPACFERGSGSRVVYGAPLTLRPHNRLSRGPLEPGAVLKGRPRVIGPPARAGQVLD